MSAAEPLREYPPSCVASGGKEEAPWCACQISYGRGRPQRTCSYGADTANLTIKLVGNGGAFGEIVVRELRVLLSCVIPGRMAAPFLARRQPSNSSINISGAAE